MKSNGLPLPRSSYANETSCNWMFIVYSFPFYRITNLSFDRSSGANKTSLPLLPLHHFLQLLPPAAPYHIGAALVGRGVAEGNGGIEMEFSRDAENRFRFFRLPPRTEARARSPF